MIQATPQNIIVGQEVLWNPATDRKHTETVIVEQIESLARDCSVYIKRENGYHRWVLLLDLYLSDVESPEIRDETQVTIQELKTRRVSKQLKIDERLKTIETYKVLIANLTSANDANAVEMADINAQITLLEAKN